MIIFFDMKIPKRPGQMLADEIERRKRESMEEYFDSLQDKGFEVLESRFLTKVERMQIKYPVFWNGGRYVIVIE